MHTVCQSKGPLASYFGRPVCNLDMHSRGERIGDTGKFMLEEEEEEEKIRRERSIYSTSNVAF
jgi:hypothetical protein